MKNLFSSSLVIAALLCLAGPVQAEKADRNKPMNIEADSLRYDDLKQISVFTGRVVLTKGSIQIRGDRLEVRQDPDGYQFGVATGSVDKLAFYRQKREAVDEFIEGEGETITYDGRADTVTFSRRAQLRRLRGTTVADEITGGNIVYENLTDLFTVDGVAKNAPAGTLGSGRVRVMLTPKPETPAGAPAAPAADPAKLKPSSTLGAPAK
ncbi:lipopolysaccharide transport periplasmic protein LptA [Rhodoferax lacus]|uniref:Lipopolysaccharide export system protein LptA n=1 Tax=Rhodoferax lacus TaxID=2184758 RepID=A0A3E1R9Q5_9BURK|nr:lipopolysaccharide transport periplasmic protein LptA [Rhodoferax lacus]RFO96085.1 lipopolysaccharide transport periplasmic protein LptA [Rhodoferax lacus]